MTTKIGIFDITLAPDADTDAFEEAFRANVFPTAGVGQQTRGGIVTSQVLLGSEACEGDPTYAWMVKWENQGGSPFGADDAPNDPAALLEDFGARTSFRRLRVVEEHAAS